MREWLKTHPPREVCISARTNDLITSIYEPTLAKAGIPHVVGKTDAEADLGDGARLSEVAPI